MQFSTGMVLFALVCQWIREPATPVATERGRVLTFAVALVLLCGSSILSMVLAAAPLLLALGLLPRQRCVELLRHFWLVWTATLTLLLSLGIYYLWTLFSGDRATAIASSDWKNFIFVGYELTGFSGWGPGRLEIRSQGLGVFRPYAVGLVTYGLVMAALIGLAAGDLRRRFGAGKMWLVFFATILPSAFLVTASAFQHFRILGRHHAAMLPAVIIFFGFCVTSAWRRGRLGRILVLLFFGLQLASALSLRFAARHEKDDYRAAAAFAKGALNAGQTVWWNADANAAIYYEVPLTRYGPPEPGRAYWIIHATPEQLAELKPPAAIVTSRPDVYDELGNLARYAITNGYRADASLVAFKLWTLKP
jgi:hypothetical protein